MYVCMYVSLSLSLPAVEGMKAVEIDQCKQELKQLKCFLASDQYIRTVALLKSFCMR